MDDVAASPTEPLGTLEEGRGPTLLAVHGALTNGRLTFAGVLSRWAAKRHVVVVDRPGYELTPGPWVDVGRQAERLVATAQDIGAPVDLLACSYGGLVALHAVQQSPRDFRSVLLVEVPALGLCPPDMVQPQALLRAAERARFALTDDIGAAYEEVFAVVDASLNRALRSLVRSGDPGVSLFAEELDLTAAAIDRRRLVEAVTGTDGRDPIPVLAVSGTRSHPAYRTFGACIAASLSGRHHVIEGAGHATHLHPSFTAAMEDFLDPLP